MLERLGKAGNYLGSVINRTTGRSAWMEAMQQPKRRPDDSSPSWSIPINHALDTVAPAYAGLELLAPATSRLISPILRATYTETVGRKDSLKAVLAVPAMAFDMALNSTILFSGSTIQEMMAWKLTVNAATHIGLDAASAVANRIRNHRTNRHHLAV